MIRRMATDNERDYTTHLIQDLATLEDLLKQNKVFETSEDRCGIEQELFLVDKRMRVSPVAADILNALDGPEYTPELARYNMEVNLEPQTLHGMSFKALEDTLKGHLQAISNHGKRYGTDWLLTGILPTLTLDDVHLGMISPERRYQAMMTRLMHQNPEDFFTYFIQGEEQLHLRHHSSFLEACNTSFQMHYQVTPRLFADAYNFAQLIAAPVLAASCNSPFLFGKKLWHETRLSLFQQALDTRPLTDPRRQQRRRVTFGGKWCKHGALELFRDEVSAFRPLLTDVEEAAGHRSHDVPELATLQHFNGTVYRWNRPRYGVIDGKATLRIENRYLPAGPTLADQAANAALWLGLMAGRPPRYQQLYHRMPFSVALNNFKRAARMGLATEFEWLDKKRVTPAELLLTELIPIAEAGLKDLAVDRDEVDHYLNIVRERVETGQTGSVWMLNSLNELVPGGNRTEAMLDLTASMHQYQREGEPVHTWTPALPGASQYVFNHESFVEEVMTGDLFTVREQDPVSLPRSIMTWQDRAHIPVEDEGGVYRGMILPDCFPVGAELRDHASVGDVMVQDLPTIHPRTPVHLAVFLMMDQRLSVLPVLENGRLVGVFTERDFAKVSGIRSRKMIQNYMRAGKEDGKRSLRIDLPAQPEPEAEPLVAAGRRNTAAAAMAS